MVVHIKRLKKFNQRENDPTLTTPNNQQPQELNTETQKTIENIIASAHQQQQLEEDEVAHVKMYHKLVKARSISRPNCGKSAQIVGGPNRKTELKPKNPPTLEGFRRDIDRNGFILTETRY